MHITIVNFELDGVTADEYGSLCDELAPTFAEVPGLVSKVWLANPDTNTFGGVYLWRDKDAFMTFLDSPLFAQVMSHPALTNITSTDFTVMDGPSRITRGLAVAVA